MNVKIKRAYLPAEKGDGTRVLIDRLWPRGLSKEKAKIDLWLKEIAPSTELRKWFGHDPTRWREFRRRYRMELKSQREPLTAIARKAREHTVTLLFGARDTEHNEAVVLRGVIERLGKPTSSAGRRAARPS